MSPAIVEYINLPRRPAATEEDETISHGPGLFPPVDVALRGFRTLQLTGHFADPDFQAKAAAVLGVQPDTRRQGGEGERGAGERGGEGDGGAVSGDRLNNTSRDIGGTERGQRSEKKTAKNAARNAARQR